jgi:hypothetical protein
MTEIPNNPEEENQYNAGDLAPVEHLFFGSSPPIKDTSRLFVPINIQTMSRTREQVDTLRKAQGQMWVTGLFEDHSFLFAKDVMPGITLSSLDSGSDEVQKEWEIALITETEDGNEGVIDDELLGKLNLADKLRGKIPGGEFVLDPVENHKRMLRYVSKSV